MEWTDIRLTVAHRDAEQAEAADRADQAECAGEGVAVHGHHCGRAARVPTSGRNAGFRRNPARSALPRGGTRGASWAAC